ncbi:MAG: Tn3 family transposase [Cyanobacteria bacterium P01_A01_bin.40]
MTEPLLRIFGEMLDANDATNNETILGRQVKSLIQTHGGSEKIRTSWSEVTAYNNDNYLPLLWQYYSNYRASLFKLIQGLELRSTTQDRYVSDMGLRRQITDNDPLEQEKRLKYLDLVANSIILQNAFDISSIIRSLSVEGYVIKPRTLATLSPYLTGHLKRYDDYIVDFDNLPQPLETAMVIPIEPETQ